MQGVGFAQRDCMAGGGKEENEEEGRAMVRVFTNPAQDTVRDGGSSGGGSFFDLAQKRSILGPLGALLGPLGAILGPSWSAAADSFFDLAKNGRS